MNKLIKLLAKYEGKKSQVSIGNLRETLRVMNAILASEVYLIQTDDMPLNDSVTDDLNKHLFKLYKKFPERATFEECMAFLLKTGK